MGGSPADAGDPPHDVPYLVPRSAYTATLPMLLLSMNDGPVSTVWPPPRVLALTLYSHSESIAGLAAGKRLASEGAKKVLCVLQAQGQVQLEARCAGVKQGLGSEGTMEKLYVDGTNNSAMLSGITAKLRQDKNIDHVLTLGAPVALVALQSVSQANSNAKVVTFDTNPALVAKIKSGDVKWAVDQQPFLQGYESIDALWLFKVNGNILGGGQTVLTGPSFIDSSNIGKVAVYAERGTR